MDRKYTYIVTSTLTSTGLSLLHVACATRHAAEAWIVEHTISPFHPPFVVVKCPIWHPETW